MRSRNRAEKIRDRAVYQGRRKEMGEHHRRLNIDLKTWVKVPLGKSSRGNLGGQRQAAYYRFTEVGFTSSLASRRGERRAALAAEY